MLRAVITLVVVALGAGLAWARVDDGTIVAPPPSRDGTIIAPPPSRDGTVVGPTPSRALDALEALPVKGRAPKTGYSRDRFGDGWKTVAGCDTRDLVLRRDLTDKATDGDCVVRSGRLQDPYTAAPIAFVRGGASEVDIDHVVALGDAWQKGAQTWPEPRRVAFANDPLNLLSVDAGANRQKGDGDAATWLPPNKPFRCEYVARQVAVKRKYGAWVTHAEHDAIARVLTRCPRIRIPRAGPSVVVPRP